MRKEYDVTVCPACGQRMRVYNTVYRPRIGALTRYRTCENRQCFHVSVTVEIPKEVYQRLLLLEEQEANQRD